jgi:hypothetical protein
MVASRRGRWRCMGAPVDRARHGTGKRRGRCHGAKLDVTGRIVPAGYDNEKTRKRLDRVVHAAGSPTITCPGRSPPAARISSRATTPTNEICDNFVSSASLRASSRASSLSSGVRRNLFSSFEYARSMARAFARPTVAPSRRTGARR